MPEFFTGVGASPEKIEESEKLKKVEKSVGNCEYLLKFLV